MVDAEAQRDVGAVGRGTDHDFLRARRQMQRGLVARREQASRFDHDLHAEFAPWQFGGVAFGEHLQRLAVEKNRAALDLDLMANLP